MSAAHTRLRQAHELWHRTAASYAIPEEFVLNLNNLITTLRQVTFMLQNQKDKISDFETWYEVGWRARLKDDPVMAWLHDARTKIEHVGDLDLESTAMVTVVASWLDGPYAEFAVPPHVGPEEIAANFEAADLPEQVRREGLLKVERRWVSSDLPGYELTDVCAHGYGVMATILAEAHERLGVKMRTFSGETHKGQHDRVEHLGGKLPCMLMTQEARTAHLHLASGDLVEMESELIEFRVKDVESFQRKSEAMMIDWEHAFSDLKDADAFEIAARLSSIACRMLAHDGYHSPIALFFKASGQPLGLTRLNFGDQAEKYLAFRNLAEDAEKRGADTVIFIGEVWNAQIRKGEDITKMKRASDRPDRTEALNVQVATADGRSRCYHTPFTRDDSGNPVLGKTEIIGREVNASFFPLHQMWNRRSASHNS